jgi:hypothetical protein
MASGIYNRVKYDLMTKQIDLANDTIKVALMNNSHTFNASHQFFSEVAGNEIPESGNVNYVDGGATLGSKTLTTLSNVVYWDAADTVWSTATFTAYHAVVYDTSNVDSGELGSLICSIDFSGPKSVTSENFKIRWDVITNSILSLA